MSMCNSWNRPSTQKKNAKYLYTIPNFQNPSRHHHEPCKAQKVYELCRDHNVIVLEDNPYGELRFEGEPLPPIKSFDQKVLSCMPGPFSKVIAPGMRVGYAIGPKPLFQKMVVCKQREDVHSNIWAQSVCHRFMTQYDYEAHLRACRKYTAGKAKICWTLMEQHLKPLITWNKFEGGLFAWCTLQGN